MTMSCFCGMVGRWKAFKLISSRDHCHGSSPSRISDTPRAGLEPAQNPSSGFVELNCAIVIITTSRCYITTTSWHLGTTAPRHHLPVSVSLKKKVCFSQFIWFLINRVCGDLATAEKYQYLVEISLLQPVCM